MFGSYVWRRHTVLILTLITALIDAAPDSSARTTAKTHAIAIEGLQYSPPRIEVNAGDIVSWTNKDPFPHTVTANDRSFDSGEIASNRTWKLKTREKGSFPYVCTLHPTMKGVLVVK